MRLYRVVTRSGVNLDIVAKGILDDPALSDVICFYQDEAQYQLVATVKRAEVAGLILMPEKSSAIPRYA